MDDLDRKILSLLAKNARMPVKEIAEQVALTSPAVSSRIHKLETDGIISGYTVVLNRPADRVYVDALISLSVGASMTLLFVVATSAQNRELAVSERTKEQIRQRLEIATMLNSCVGKLNSDTDIDVGINNLLATVNGYFQADRTYVFEIDPDRDVLINTFEYICGQEVSAQMDNLQEVPVSVIEVWMQNFRQGRSYYMSDLEQERGQPRGR